MSDKLVSRPENARFTPGEFNKLKVALKLQAFKDETIKDNLSFDVVKDSDTGSTYTIVSYRSSDLGAPWTDLRGIIVKEFDRVVSRTTGYTESISVNSLVSTKPKSGPDTRNVFHSETDSYIRVKKSDGTPVFLDLRRGHLRVNLEGALLRVWKQDGKVYVSTQKKISAENSKWRSKESFLASYRSLGGLEEELFSEKGSSPYCHRFLLVTRNSQTATYADCGEGYVVYYDTIKCYEPLDSEADQEQSSFLRDIQDIKTPSGDLEEVLFDGEYGVSSQAVFRNIDNKPSDGSTINFNDDDEEVDENDERDVKKARSIYPFINDDDRRCFTYLYFNTHTEKWEERSLSPSRADGILRYGGPQFAESRDLELTNLRPIFSSGEALFYSGQSKEGKLVTYRLVPNCYNVRRIVNSQDYDSSPNREILNLRRIAVYPNGAPANKKTKDHHEMVRFSEVANSLKKYDNGKLVGYLGLPTDGTAAAVYPHNVKVKRDGKIVEIERIYGPLSVEKRALAVYDQALIDSSTSAGITARWSVLALGQFLALPYHKQKGYCASFDSSAKLIPQIVKFIVDHSVQIVSGKGVMQEAPWNSDLFSVKKARERIIDIAKNSTEKFKTQKGANKNLSVIVDGFVQNEFGASLDRINSVMNPSTRA